MPVSITPTTTEITNNLSDVINYCLDPLILEITSTTAKFLRVKYAIDYKGLVAEAEILNGIFNNNLKVDIGKPIQPYIYLSEVDINNYFTNYKLDMAPANVVMTLETLDKKYEVLGTFTLTAKFHAGKSSAVPADGSVINRRLNYNSVLPLVYRYPGENVEYKFQGKSKLFNKQAESSALNIFQMMFFQQYHFADASKNKGGFSAGFGPGFATDVALENANPLFRYEEGFFNEIISTYSVFGVNFPLELNSQNIIWLDENNIFQGMCLTGDEIGEPDYLHFMNPYSVDFRQRKAGTVMTSNLKINTGFILKSEVPLVDSLIRAQRAWLFKDKISERLEVICTSKKIKTKDSSRQLIDFQLEFETNEQ